MPVLSRKRFLIRTMYCCNVNDDREEGGGTSDSKHRYMMQSNAQPDVAG